MVYLISVTASFCEAKVMFVSIGQAAARQVMAYARVSSHDQKQDLDRQVGALLSYCKDHKLQCQVVKDLGSGLNYNKRGLNQLIEEICLGRVSQLILTHKDRLLRFGSALLFKLCKFYNTKVVILNASQDLRFEEELANDVIEIITVFSAKLYGKRSHQNRRRAA